jgi:hypothetical protein
MLPTIDIFVVNWKLLKLWVWKRHYTDIWLDIDGNYFFFFFFFYNFFWLLADVVRRSTAQQNPAKSERHGFFFFLEIRHSKTKMSLKIIKIILFWKNNNNKIINFDRVHSIKLYQSGAQLECLSSTVWRVYCWIIFSKKKKKKNIEFFNIPSQVLRTCDRSLTLRWNLYWWVHKITENTSVV